MPMQRIQGTTWRVTPRGVTRRITTEPWEAVTPAQLRALAVDSAEWQWLREQGVKRPSPIGTPDTRTDDERLGTRMTLRLDPDVTTALDALTRRWGVVRSHAIARAITTALETGK
jgi:hypothetical protein